MVHGFVVNKYSRWFWRTLTSEKHSTKLILSFVVNWSCLKWFLKYYCPCSTPRNSTSVGIKGIVDYSQRCCNILPSPQGKIICHSTQEKVEVTLSPLKCQPYHMTCFVQLVIRKHTTSSDLEKLEPWFCSFGLLSGTWDHTVNKSKLGYERGHMQGEWGVLVWWFANYWTFEWGYIVILPDDYMNDLRWQK